MSDVEHASVPKTVRLADYQPPAFLIDSVDLVFELGEAETRVKSRLSIRRNPAGDPAAPLRLDGEDLALVSLQLDGAALGGNAYNRNASGLTIPDVPGEFQLDLETRIRPQENTALVGLYKSGGNFCTQCEAEGFRRITYFIDRPDIMARYTTTIVADKAAYPVLLSNGNPAGAGDAAGGRHWAKWVDPHPKPSYLFALVAGDLVPHRDSFTTGSGRVIPLAIWVRRGDEDKCAHAMASLKAAMRWDETRFGLEYDLEVFNIVAVSDFNMGAMENKGLNIFNTKYVLAKPETATDADYEGIESVVAHEYFHNWTGDRVTCRDWFQLSLKEGLTVYRDQEFSADQTSAAVRRIGEVRGLRAAQFPEDAGPLAHPVQPDHYMEIENFYTATVYQKGAEVVRMLATLLGRDGFRKGMDLYFRRHDNQAVTIEDFVAAMADANGRDLAAFLRWYHQAGTPEITYDDEYDPVSRSYTLTLAQRTPPTPGQPEKQPVVVPVAMGLIGPGGAPQPMKLVGEAAAGPDSRVLVLDKAESSFRFEGVPARPVPSLFRGFSAPVRIKGVPLERLKFLATHDSDPFARWDAQQQVGTALLLGAVAARQEGREAPLDPDLLAAFRETLRRADDDPAFAAEMLALPGEAFLADQMEVVDVDGIHEVRERARREIAAALAPDLEQIYARLADRGPYRPDGPSMGRRALRNTALSYLALTGAKGVALAKAQFDAAANMTDVIAALAVLVDRDDAVRDDVLRHFYDKWQKEELVVDKWFALQAMSRARDTLERVRKLKQHPAFDIRNPNRTRALIGAFAGNQVHFHSGDGAGYAFLGEQIAALDPLNPNIAARLVQPFAKWRRFDPARQALIRRELERILARPNLSKNTYEQASKSLQ